MVKTQLVICTLILTAACGIVVGAGVDGIGGATKNAETDLAIDAALPGAEKRLSQAEYLSAKAQAWKTYRREKKECLSFDSWRRAVCLENAQYERRNKIAEAMSRLMPGASDQLTRLSTGAIAGAPRSRPSVLSH
jgi:hypothetical protein